MLKFTYIANLGILGMFAVPPALQGTGSFGLEKALEETVTALDDLTQTQATITAGDYAAVDELLASTESPVANPQESTAIKNKLRDEVSRLQMALDTLESDYVLPPVTVESVGATQPKRTTGLTDSQRSEIGGILVPVPGGKQTSEILTEEGTASFERAGFTASYARHGRAYYRAGRYEEGIALLRHAPENDAESMYWRARCLERTNKLNEAVAAYTKVIENPSAGSLADRAKDDRGFIEWKIAFSSKVEDQVERRMTNER
ncbi:MAG: tetratricopeptide repeat protein [Planctomycetes bacterium]|nr:tetratricopeptide repeat protein [Planctomycetota bacterium]MCB9905045.1 tetratricopeptide repeat protein [Planctomycetota bacterium]